MRSGRRRPRGRAHRRACRRAPVRAGRDRWGLRPCGTRRGRRQQAPSRHPCAVPRSAREGAWGQRAHPWDRVLSAGKREARFHCERQIPSARAAPGSEAAPPSSAMDRARTSSTLVRAPSMMDRAAASRTAASARASSQPRRSPSLKRRSARAAWASFMAEATSGRAAAARNTAGAGSTRASILTPLH